ncbi:poly(A)-specific ribonuclease PARN isoform X2 [Orussus abietinus]|uniref:poly(A)-specific ribonuclease PARN isoform X2 n=1 Tax=Orussus abietinus TaxID=222816 RepID=UPI0006256042|nr:poly(A)-specific ribonuclease PARN isoform X2 [Orussus abietinus]
MEVTSENFQEVLDELDTVLPDAAFLAIDGEFTGLIAGPAANAFNTPKQYYDSIRSGSMDFLLVQLGLSVFTYDTERDTYMQRSYNFYVFPRPFNRMAPDCRFMCQASSVAFLIDKGFDFNKLFRLGIPYLTSEDRNILKKKLEMKQQSKEKSAELILISEEDKPCIEDICSRIDGFVKSEEEELSMEWCNSYIRKVLRQEVKLRWPGIIKVDAKSDVSNKFVIKKMGTIDEEEQKESERKEQDELELKQASGLSTLVEKISKSKKLLVGHNMFFDICHIIHQFVQPLPAKYTTFKSQVQELFPRILDTRIMCQSPKFKGIVRMSHLHILLETVSKEPFTMPKVEGVEGRCYSTQTDKTHEAGYDAYITGLCFISLSNYLGSLENPKVSTVLSDSPLLESFMNKVIFGRLIDMPYISLNGEDPNPSRDHVFHITFPKTWRTNEIQQKFQPVGGILIHWINDTSAYVSLKKRNQRAMVLKKVRQTKQFQILSYADHQASLEIKDNDSVNANDDKLENNKAEEAPSANVITAEEEEEQSREDKDDKGEENEWKMVVGKRKRKLSASENPSKTSPKRTFVEDTTWE